MSEKYYYKLEYEEGKGVNVSCNMPFPEIVNVLLTALANDIAVGAVKHNAPLGLMTATVVSAVESDIFSKKIKDKILEMDPNYDFEKEAKDALVNLLKSISEDLENGN